REALGLGLEIAGRSAAQAGKQEARQAAPAREFELLRNAGRPRVLLPLPATDCDDGIAAVRHPAAQQVQACGLPLLQVALLVRRFLMHDAVLLPAREMRLVLLVEECRRSEREAVARSVVTFLKFRGRLQKCASYRRVAAVHDRAAALEDERAETRHEVVEPGRRRSVEPIGPCSRDPDARAPER